MILFLGEFYLQTEQSRLGIHRAKLNPQISSLLDVKLGFFVKLNLPIFDRDVARRQSHPVEFQEAEQGWRTWLR